MEGRFHFYEGYDMKEVTFPERVMYELGIETLFVSNASGGMNPDFRIGDLMIIDDHINFFPEHPLRGKNFPTGPRFPDMHEAYDKKLISLADDIAKEKGIPPPCTPGCAPRPWPGRAPGPPGRSAPLVPPGRCVHKPPPPTA